MAVGAAAVVAIGGAAVLASSQSSRLSGAPTAPSTAAPSADAAALVAEVVAVDTAPTAAYGPSATFALPLPEGGWAAFRIWFPADDAVVPDIAQTFRFAPAETGAYQLSPSSGFPLAMGLRLEPTAQDVDAAWSEQPTEGFFAISLGGPGELTDRMTQEGFEPFFLVTVHDGASVGLRQCGVEQCGLSLAEPGISVLAEPVEPVETLHSKMFAATAQPAGAQAPATAELPVVAGSGTDRGALLAELAAIEPTFNGETWGIEAGWNPLTLTILPDQTSLGQLMDGIAEMTLAEVVARLAAHGWDAEVSTSPVERSTDAEWLHFECPFDQATPCKLVVPKG
ncbi:MAG: hypothetical protein LBC97_14335 [Bifidobacteriaceae bacterium]|nr:hypothetical protein [Bifidobacteriaceae bacterium]